LLKEINLTNPVTTGTKTHELLKADSWKVVLNFGKTNLEQLAQSFIQLSAEHFQGWRLHYLPCQPATIFDYPQY